MPGILYVLSKKVLLEVCHMGEVAAMIPLNGVMTVLWNVMEL